MYLISIYFDERTNKRIQHWIDQVAAKTGNLFMQENHVPPHITISAFEARDDLTAIQLLEEKKAELKSGTLQWVSIGAFLPYVIYLAPVYNAYLHELSDSIYDIISTGEDIIVNRYYQPMQWLPHATIGKKLSKEEMRIAFQVLQEQFRVFEGKVVKIGLAKPNPHRDLIVFEL